MESKQSTKPAVPVVTKKRIFSSRLFFFLLPFIIGGIMLVVFFYPEYQQQQIIKSGLPADAVVLGLKDTGNRYNDQPQVRLSVEVRPEELEPYPATITMVISQCTCRNSSRDPSSKCAMIRRNLLVWQ